MAWLVLGDQRMTAMRKWLHLHPHTTVEDFSICDIVM